MSGAEVGHGDESGRRVLHFVRAARSPQPRRGAGDPASAAAISRPAGPRGHHAFPLARVPLGGSSSRLPGQGSRPAPERAAEPRPTRETAGPGLRRGRSCRSPARFGLSLQTPPTLPERVLLAAPPGGWDSPVPALSRGTVSVTPPGRLGSGLPRTGREAPCFPCLALGTRIRLPLFRRLIPFLCSRERLPVVSRPRPAPPPSPRDKGSLILSSHLRGTPPPRVCPIRPRRAPLPMLLLGLWEHGSLPLSSDSLFSVLLSPQARTR